MSSDDHLIDDYFFFSYARGDERDEIEENRDHLFVFFEQLCSEIRKREARLLRDIDPIGFIDQKNLGLGSNYRDRLPAALQKCRSLVCMYSPLYFTRKICGKEVQVFLDRQANHGGNPEVILPVIWRMPDQIPEPMQPIQFIHRDFPAIYREKGLRELMIQKGNEREYRLCVVEIADWILAANNYKLKPLSSALDLDTITEAFPRVSIPATGAASEQIRREGPKAVRFIYVAGTDPGWTWRPFPPPPDNEIGKIAYMTALTKGFFPGQLDLTPEFITELEEAKKNNTLVVLLVDAHTLEVQPTSRLLDSYDGRNFLNCAALIIWDAAVPHTASRETALRDLLKSIFDDNYARNYPQFFRDNVRSLKDLREQLSEILDTLYRNVLSKGSPTKSVPSGSAVPSI